MKLTAVSTAPAGGRSCHADGAVGGMKPHLALFTLRAEKMSFKASFVRKQRSASVRQMQLVRAHVRRVVSLQATPV